MRVGEILETTSISEWRWVPTKLNVADEATKWGKGPDVEPNSRWFKGPEFLYMPEECWPQQTVLSADTNEELRSILVHQELLSSSLVVVSRFSKWERLLRSVAYVLHFVDNCRARKEHRTNLLDQTDFDRAERMLWRLAQTTEYADELGELSRTSKEAARRQIRFDKSSKIRKLSPFLDEFGVIRMEGRIEASPYASYNAKYPIILPKEHYVTELLIDWYHRSFGHGFSETIVNEIRQKFHVSNLRVLVRRIAKRCQLCQIQKAEPKTPRMAPLPVARAPPYERPFTRVGIDYCGPFAIKIFRSNVKRWVALFTCLVTRAVHLEVVATLSTESCKLALRRFIDRRGAPAEIYTDDGTNFQGTCRELTKQLASVNKGLAESFTDANTKWFFIPPATPHMGGVWERLVRSIKVAMNGIQHLRAPTEEVFQTLCTEAESMMNCRPLTYVPLDTSDQEALTPNHFLLLSSSGIKQTVKQPTSEGKALRSDWDQCQLMLDRFWTRWIQGALVFIVNDKERNS